MFLFRSYWCEWKKNAAKLNRYIFDNSKIETVYNYEGDKAEIFDLKMCKDKVFFRQSVGNERLKSELYEWDIAGQRANKIAEGICSYTLKADEKLAYWKAFDGIYEIPMTTGNTAENIVEKREKKYSPVMKIQCLALLLHQIVIIIYII